MIGTLEQLEERLSRHVAEGRVGIHVIAPINPLPSVHLLTQFALLRSVLEKVIEKIPPPFTKVNLDFLSFGDFILGVELFECAISRHFANLMPSTSGDLAKNVITLKAAELGSVAQMFLGGLMKPNDDEPLCPPQLLMRSRFSLLTDYLSAMLARAKVSGPERHGEAKAMLSGAQRLVKRLTEPKEGEERPEVDENLLSIFAHPDQQGLSILSAVIGATSWLHDTDDSCVIWLGDMWMAETLNEMEKLDLQETEEEVRSTSLECLVAHDFKFSTERVRFFLTPFSEFCHEDDKAEFTDEEARLLAPILHDLNCVLFKNEEVSDFARYLKDLEKWKHSKAFGELQDKMPSVIDDVIANGFTGIERTLVEQIRYIL